MFERHARPYAWDEILPTTQSMGGAILEGVLSPGELATINAEIDTYLAREGETEPDSGSESYDTFLGFNTIRRHGLLEKFPSASQVIQHPELISWVDDIMAPISSRTLLNAAELIEIQPGEPRQAAHRDSDSWPIPLTEHPFIVNIIYALDDFTLENGATWVAPYSWQWQKERRANTEEYERAVMRAGDAILFRGDLIHRGGANESTAARRAISVSYCAGWLRPVENSYLNISRDTLVDLPESLQSLLGYAAYDGEAQQSGLAECNPGFRQCDPIADESLSFARDSLSLVGICEYRHPRRARLVQRAEELRTR